jgi:hypothetical protein
LKKPTTDQLWFTPLQAERDYQWQMELWLRWKTFVERVESALDTEDPNERKAMYQSWRLELGDEMARNYARYAEQIIAGGSRARIDAANRLLISNAPKRMPKSMIMGELGGE